VAAQRAWTYGHLLIGMIVPLVVIAVANALLLRRLRLFADRSTFRRGAAVDTTELSGTTRADADSSGRRQRASQNMARLVLAIVIIFVVCQLPYHVIEVDIHQQKSLNYLYILPSININPIGSP